MVDWVAFIDAQCKPTKKIKIYNSVGVVTIKWAKNHVGWLPKLFQNYNFVRYIFVEQGEAIGAGSQYQPNIAHSLVQ
jgi:hypothetical protein